MRLTQIIDIKIPLQRRGFMTAINPIQSINPYAVFRLIVSKKEQITKIALEALAALAISQAAELAISQALFSEEISSEEDRWNGLSPTESNITQFCGIV